VHADGGDQLLVVGDGGVVGLHVGHVLEVVGVQVAGRQRHVGGGVLGVDDDLQLDALRRQVVLDQLQDLGMRRGGRPDDQLLGHDHTGNT